MSLVLLLLLLLLLLLPCLVQAQHEVETGRVEIPDEGIFIKSARLSKQRGSDVYFKLQHVRTASNHEKPLQVLDNLQAGYVRTARACTS